jgi:hypothetical protein
MMIQLRSLKIQLENLTILLDDAKAKGEVDQINKIKDQIKDVLLLINYREDFLKRNESPK